VTEYILAVTGKGAIGSGDAEPLARAMESFVLMYQNHAAREDTIAGLERDTFRAPAA
jgi:hypothetical protein